MGRSAKDPCIECYDHASFLPSTVLLGGAVSMHKIQGGSLVGSMRDSLYQSGSALPAAVSTLLSAVTCDG